MPFEWKLLSIIIALLAVLTFRNRFYRFVGWKFVDVEMRLTRMIRLQSFYLEELGIVLYPADSNTIVEIHNGI